jgi:hypothetical protein
MRVKKYQAPHLAINYCPGEENGSFNATFTGYSM